MTHGLGSEEPVLMARLGGGLVDSGLCRQRSRPPLAGVKRGVERGDEAPETQSVVELGGSYRPGGGKCARAWVALNRLFVG